MQYQKVKSVAKSMLSRGESLNELILRTMKSCADLVGSTLGPGGMSVVIERQEHNIPPMVTKDGVTVFRNLGFDDSTAHVLMEAARDAAVRTASEAGDGTTSATILAEAFVRYTMQFCKANPKMSPQRVVRTLENVFKSTIEPEIKKISLRPQLSDDKGKEILRSVARISANGDSELADAVMQCFDLVGDDGNVTIIESNGPSHYEVERIEGYPIAMGYEESCSKFYQKFINDPGTQQCVLSNPCFILYHGRLTELHTALPLLERIAEAAEQQGFHKNVVFVATGFSEVVLAHLAVNFADPMTIKVFPLLAPLSPIANGQYDFLADLAALSGATIFDPLDNPLDKATLDQLGDGISAFECGRFRSSVIGHRDEVLILERVDQLQKQISNAASELDSILLKERLGKITGGIAKLKVIGSSNGELKEKRDRAEDAVCAVRGAIKHGALPGGGWTLLKFAVWAETQENPIYSEVLAKALMEPLFRLYKNAGFSQEETTVILSQLTEAVKNNNPTVYDLLDDKFVNAIDGGLMDSTPAVLEAIRNSLSIATLLGTCGGTVVFKRDLDFERSEARDTADFVRNANVNPADERW